MVGSIEESIKYIHVILWRIFQFFILYITIYFIKIPLHVLLCMVDILLLFLIIY